MKSCRKKNTSTNVATASTVVQHRQVRWNVVRKNAKKRAAPTNPWEKITIHRWPCVPSGGTPHALQSGVSAPAIDVKFPCTSRVLPNPITGDPCTVLATV